MGNAARSIYPWIAILGGCLLVFAELPARLLSNVLIADPLKAPLTVSIFLFLAAGLTAPVAGHLVDRTGGRRTILVGIGIGGGGLVLYGLAPHLVLIYLALVLAGAGKTFGGWMPVMVGICRRFQRPAMAIALAMTVGELGKATALSVLVALLLTAVNSDFGLISAGTLTLALGAALLAVAVMAAVQLRRRTNSSLPTSPGFTARQALRTPAFRHILTGNALAAASASVVILWLVADMVDQGYSRQSVTWALTLPRLIFPFSILVGGFVGSRYSLRGALVVFTVLQAAGIAMLAFADSTTLILLAFGLSIVGEGGRVPLAVTIQYDYFGIASLGKILGWQLLLTGVLETAMFILLQGLTEGIVNSATYPYLFAALAFLTLLGALSFLRAFRPSLPEDTPDRPAL